MPLESTEVTAVSLPSTSSVSYNSAWY